MAGKKTTPQAGKSLRAKEKGALSTGVEEEIPSSPPRAGGYSKAIGKGLPVARHPFLNAISLEATIGELSLKPHPSTTAGCVL